jgi:DNA-binding MarR family transcriptional regulator
MSRPEQPSPDYVPLIALVHRLNRALQQDMVREAHRRGHAGLKSSHNAVFATLDPNGSRAADMAAQTGMTRQSMGEIVREMAELGIVEMKPDPADRRAKLVTWTDQGLQFAREGYEHILDVEDRYAAALGAEKFAWLRRALVQMTDLLEDESSGPLPDGPTG